MDEYLNTNDVANLYKVSHQTVKNWADQFGDFLSPTATPGRGRRRVFVTEDLKVFALLADFHRRGHTYEDARVALGAGQRGDIPDVESAITVPPAVMLRLQDEIKNLQQQLRDAEKERDKERGKVELLTEQLAAAHRRIEELIRDSK